MAHRLISSAKKFETAFLCSLRKGNGILKVLKKSNFIKP